MHIRPLFFSLVLLLVFSGAGCERETPTEPAPPTTSPRAAARAVVAACPNAEKALSGEPQGALAGDVTGDGQPESVALFKDREGEPGCAAFMALDGGDGGVVAVTQEGASPETGLPSLERLAQIDGRPGLDVVVRLLTGASTEFVGVYTAGGGALERLHVEDATGLGDLFPYGGGVTHLDGIDCDDSGRVVVASAVSGDGVDYQVTRTTYEFEDVALVPVETSEITMSAEEAAALPELEGAPFGSCPTS